MISAKSLAGFMQLGPFFDSMMGNWDVNVNIIFQKQNRGSVISYNAGVALVSGGVHPECSIRRLTPTIVGHYEGYYFNGMPAQGRRRQTPAQNSEPGII